MIGRIVRLDRPSLVTVFAVALWGLSHGPLGAENIDCSNEIYIYIDRSGSVVEGGTAGTTSQYDRVINAITRFVMSARGALDADQLNVNDKVSVILFGDRPEPPKVYDFNSNLDQRTFYKDLKPTPKPSDYTDLVSVFEKIQTEATASKGRRSFIVVSDFAHDVPGDQDIEDWEAGFGGREDTRQQGRGDEKIGQRLRCNLKEPYSNLLVLFKVQALADAERRVRKVVLESLEKHLPPNVIEYEVGMDSGDEILAELEYELQRVNRPILIGVEGLPVLRQLRVRLQNISCAPQKVSELLLRWHDSSPDLWGEVDEPSHGGASRRPLSNMRLQCDKLPLDALDDEATLACKPMPGGRLLDLNAQVCEGADLVAQGPQRDGKDRPEIGSGKVYFGECVGIRTAVGRIRRGGGGEELGLRLDLEVKGQLSAAHLKVVPKGWVAGARKEQEAAPWERPLAAEELARFEPDRWHWIYGIELKTRDPGLPFCSHTPLDSRPCLELLLVGSGDRVLAQIELTPDPSDGQAERHHTLLEKSLIPLVFIVGVSMIFLGWRPTVHLGELADIFGISTIVLIAVVTALHNSTRLLGWLESGLGRHERLWVFIFCLMVSCSIGWGWRKGVGSRQVPLAVARAQAGRQSSWPRHWLRRVFGTGIVLFMICLPVLGYFSANGPSDCQFFGSNQPAELRGGARR